jgi:uncharacterized UBP type Zn finger protein
MATKEEIDRVLTIFELKKKSGALSMKEKNLVREAALFGCLYRDEWNWRPEEDVKRAMLYTRNYIRHNAMVELLDRVTDIVIKEPSMPSNVLLLDLLLSLEEAYFIKVGPDIEKAKKMMIENIDKIKWKKEGCISPEDL